jgi:hypothetical protein
MSMIGRTYRLHGTCVTVLARWDAKSRGTWPSGRVPRNVLIQHADGRREVRPFRGLRRLPS